jgi:hypothetical protein
MKKPLKQILKENMRRFGTKNLNEDDNDDLFRYGGGSLQQPGMDSTAAWKEGYKKYKPSGNGIDGYSGWLVECQAAIASRLNYMATQIDKIDSFLPEIAEMIKATQTMLDTIKVKFPVYYASLNRYEYAVVEAHKNTKAQLEAVLKNPQSDRTADNLRDAASLYAIYSEESLEARNEDDVIDALQAFYGQSN